MDLNKPIRHVRESRQRNVHDKRGGLLKKMKNRELSGDHSRMGLRTSDSDHGNKTQNTNGDE